MFGEKNIIGSEIVTVKNRKIKLPAFADVEGDDVLLLIKYGEDFAILNNDKYFGLIDKLKQERESTKDKKIKMELYSLINQLYRLQIRELKCNKDFTITLPKNFYNSDKLNCDKILCIGEGKHLILKPQKKN